LPPVDIALDLNLRQEFESQSLDFGNFASPAFPCSHGELSHLMRPCLSEALDNSTKIDKLVPSFPALFSDKLGTVKGMVSY
jgi:hypothetical protein